MALSEQVVVDSVEVNERGLVLVKEVTKIIKDGAVVAKSARRYVLSPGHDLSEQPQRVQDVANAVWTEDFMTAWNAQVTDDQG